MKKLIFMILLTTVQMEKAPAQSQELQQLILNVEKLIQFKQILKDLEKSYQILSGGYNAIKNLSEGNFSLHKAFLDGLLEVSPVVRKYKRISEIIQYQLKIIKEYKIASHLFKNDPLILVGEMEYIDKVYKNILNQSVDNLDALLNVVTANSLRMSDDERLKAIDGISQDMQEKWVFLHQFISQTTLLTIQRAKEKKDTKTIQQLLGVKK